MSNATMNRSLKDDHRDQVDSMSSMVPHASHMEKKTSTSSSSEVAMSASTVSADKLMQVQKKLKEKKERRKIAKEKRKIAKKAYNNTNLAFDNRTEKQAVPPPRQLFTNLAEATNPKDQATSALQHLTKLNHQVEQVACTPEVSITSSDTQLIAATDAIYKKFDAKIAEELDGPILVHRGKNGEIREVDGQALEHVKNDGIKEAEAKDPMETAKNMANEGKLHMPNMPKPATALEEKIDAAVIFRLGFTTDEFASWKLLWSEESNSQYLEIACGSLDLPPSGYWGTYYGEWQANRVKRISKDLEGRKARAEEARNAKFFAKVEAILEQGGDAEYEESESEFSEEE